MVTKDLIKLFSSEIRYKIVEINNPHCILWCGRGNNTNSFYQNKEIKGVHTDKNKELIIYV